MKHASHTDPNASTRLGPFIVPTGDGTGMGVLGPGPMTSGPARPEPEERWTLAPGGAPASPPADEAAKAPATRPDHPS